MPTPPRTFPVTQTYTTSTCALVALSVLFGAWYAHADTISVNTDDRVATSSVPALVSDATSTPDTVATSTDPSSDDASTTDDVSSDEEDVALDLGDDHTELDAAKDMTGVVRQSKPYTCGPASLATLRTQMGETTSEEDVLRYFTGDNLTEDRGTNLLALKNAAQELGSTVYLKKLSAEQVLTYIQDTGDPVLIHDEKPGVGGHFSVIRSYDADSAMVELSDTEAGNIKYSVESFKHIYTGDTLIISDDTSNDLLNATSTDLSNDYAAEVWGKYVPVAVAANGKSAAATAAVTAFNICITNAMKTVNYTQRNNARAVCYTTLGTDLKGTSSTDPLSNFQELQVAATVEGTMLLGNLDKTNETAIGTSDLLAALRSVLAAQQTYISVFPTLTSYLSQASATLATLASTITTLQNQITPLQSKLSQAQTDKGILDIAITQKQSAITPLQNEVNGGTFVQNGTTFSLGAVGSQLSAQSTTLKTLSANLASKLSSLDGQIANKRSSINSYTSSRTYWQNQINIYQSDVNNWQSQYNNAVASVSYFWNQYQADIRARRSTSYDYTNYAAWLTKQNTYSSYLNTARSNLSSAQNNYSYYNSQINQLTSDIASLQAQKDSANSAVSAASAEAARLQRLKDFGDQEMNRKKGLLATLQSELANLQNQLSAKVASITSYTAQLTPLKAKLATLQSAQSLATQITAQTQIIDGVKAKYGFTTLTYTNQDETNRLITEELTNEKGWDRSVEVGATASIQQAAVTTAPTGVWLVGAISGVVQGLYSVAEGFETLVFSPLTTAQNIGSAVSNYDKTATAIYDGLKGRAVAIVYVDNTNFFSIYNAGVAVGSTAFDVCTVACTLGGGIAVKGVQVSKTAINVSGTADRTAEITKVAQTLRATLAAKITTMVADLKSASSISALLTKVDAYNIPNVGVGSTKVLLGSASDARVVFDAMTKGWKIEKDVVASDGSAIYVRTSTDGKYSLDYRTKSTSSISDPTLTHQATIDVVPRDAAGKPISGAQVEIKFAQ